MDNNLAVLIDFENIAAGTEKDGLGRFDVELVLARLSDKGRILISRSYADWGRFARFKQGLLQNNVSMMELTSHGMHDKNRADIAMVVEGMELAFTKPYVDTFVIVSGDSDFTPMVLKMRELDKRVIGVGCRSSTSRLLIQACDEFIFYDSLVERRTRRKTERPPATGESGKLQAAFELLLDAVEGLLREDPDPPLAGMVKTAILRKSPDFSENELGFSSFARFLEKAKKEGYIATSRDEKSGGYRVEIAPANAGASDEKAVDKASEKAADKASDRGRAKRDDNDTDDSTWLDPYLPAGTASWIEALAAEGLNPLAAPTRKAVLQAAEEAVAERSKKKQRITVQFVQEDVRRALRRSHPDLPARGIRHLFNGLMRAGVLLHRDGSPVRTGSAPFTLTKTAEELNETLADIYVDELHRSGATLDVPLLAELFFGDRTHTRPIEETMAYLQATSVEDGDGGGDRSNGADLDLDLDAALLIDDASSMDGALVVDEPAPAAEAPTEAEPARRAPRKRGGKKKAPNAEDTEATAEPGEPTDPKEAAAPEAADAPAADADGSPKPRRRRTRRKTDAADEGATDGAADGAAGGDDLDALLSAD